MSSLPKSLFEVECLDCGHISVQRGIDLEKMKDRDCLRCILFSRDANVTYVYNRVKGNAKKRNIEWDLTVQDFGSIARKSCYYCNIQPSKAPGQRERSPFYHGIDRVDNSLGYTFQNSVSCCAICNYAKHDLSIEDFKQWLTNCYNHTIVNGEQ